MKEEIENSLESLCEIFLSNNRPEFERKLYIFFIFDAKALTLQSSYLRNNIDLQHALSNDAGWQFLHFSCIIIECNFSRSRVSGKREELR